MDKNSVRPDRAGLAANGAADQFRADLAERVRAYPDNRELQQTRGAFLEQVVAAKYAYNFFWLGVPIIQIPPDLQALQEIIWETRPDLIVETGVAHGGSLIFSASMLVILEACGSVGQGEVVGVDIDIRPHNRRAIEAHPLGRKITLLQGSSIDETVVGQVRAIARNKQRVMVCLDSNHTHEHVLAELRAYAPCVSLGCYCMVGDTGIEDLPEGSTTDRPWGKGNNPKTAVWQYLKENGDFVIDKSLESKLLLTGSPDGYLKRVR